MVDGRHKPELDMFQIVELENTEPEFWSLYNEYCRVDCVALSQIWDKFNSNVEEFMDKFIEKSPFHKHNLRLKCSLGMSCTIGGHAQKILNTLQGDSYYFKNYLQFINDDVEKHDYLMKNFKRGGISHCGQKGKHNEGVMSVDICSQYPAAMQHMEIPSGNSEWTKEYDVKKYGYYRIKNVAFDKTKTYDFKPVCLAIKGESLNWKTGSKIEDLYITRNDIVYLMANYGLVSFDVVEG
jgi:hypothetical protein